MHASRLSRVVLVVTWFALPSAAHADILVSYWPDVTTGLQVVLLDNSGKKILSYTEPEEYEYWWPGDFAVDRETNSVYATMWLTQERHAVLRFDVASGSYLGGFQLRKFQQGQIHGSKYYSLGLNSDWPDLSYTFDVRDMITGHLTFTSPIPHDFGFYVRSMQVQPGDGLFGTNYYFIDNGGIFAGSISESAHTVTKIADLVPNTFQDQILIGPDGNLYVGESKGAIRRYSLTGDFQGIVIDEEDLDDLQMQEFQFGPNGDLYVYGSRPDGTNSREDQNWLKRFSGADGREISSIRLPNTYDFQPFNRFAILVPEPTAFALSLASLAGICFSRAAWRQPS